MDDRDHELFERTLRRATEQNTEGALDTALEQLGWHDAMASDPRAAISLLFDLQGAGNVTSSALGHVVISALGLGTVSTTCVVLPTVGQWDPPGTLEGHDLRVRGLATAALTGQERVIVVASAGDDVVAFTVPTSSLEIHQVEGVDPSLGLVQVTRDGGSATTGLPVVSGGWTSAVALARLAIAHELVGVSKKMLELAREHALGRIQFGRPISSFQAIRHRLAETLVAIETAEAIVDAAWIDGSPGTAAMAKAVAGRQARTTARHCQQVLAGIGFTTEHPFHLYLRRTLVLDGLFGTAASLTRGLGAEMIRSQQLPPLLPL